MSLGLEGALGADALSNSIRQRIADQIAAQQQQFQNSLALRSADRADKQQQILQAEHEAALKERSAAVNEKIGGDTATMLGAGQTVLSPQSPTASRLMNSSASALVRPDQTLPSTQMAGASLLPNGSDRSQWDSRSDGSRKGDGFFGVLPRQDGRVSSEISIGVNIGGKETEIPTLVPTLSPDERRWLLTNDVSDPSKIPPQIIQKAVDYARQRMTSGQSPFATADEAPQGIPSTSVTQQAPKLTGQLRFMGTPKANQDENQRILRGRLLSDPSLTPQQKLEMQAEGAGLKAPSREPNIPSEPLTPVGPRGILTPRSQAAGQPIFTPPHEAATVTIQTVDDNGRKVTRVVPKADALGKDFASPESATMSNRLASAKAVTQTGNDMIAALSDPKLASQLGPLMSRYNNLADFVGNPPPEFAKLAGQIESYALANMGVHGMRANTGAEAIKATLGAGRHTPETIIAVIQGLNGFANHLMQNEGQSAPAPAAQSTAPSVQKWVRRGGKLVPE